MCTFVSWSAEHEYPKGKVTGILGLKYDLWAQKQALILQHMTNLCKNSRLIPICNITPKITLPNVKTETTIGKIPADVADLRKERIYTIDPLTARDLDDALSITQISENEYKIGVHIAGVSRVVKEGGEIDL